MLLFNVQQGIDMSAQHRVNRSILLSVASLLFFNSSAYSAGFALIENSASGMGKAFAGAAASAEDASTVWFNPAGMTYLGKSLEGKSQLSNALHIIIAGSEFTDKGSAAPASLNATMNGDKNGSNTVISPVPNLYYVRPINDRLHFGLAVNGPFGSKTEYDRDWIGRYHATDTDMKTVNINPSISWKASDKLSLGAGISAQYINVTLGKSVDSVAACRKIAAGVAAQTNSSALLSYCNKTYPKASQVEKDSQATVEGDDLSFGFNLGLLYQPTEMTRIGVSYRSKVKHDLEGRAKYDVDSGLLPVIAQTGITAFTDKDIEASVELPDSLSLSLVHKVSNRLELLGDVTWTQWSSFQELLVNDTAGNEVTKTVEDWEDVTRISLGANYKYNDKLTLRTGVAFDEEPIPSAKLRTPRIPGNDRTWLSFGAGYKLNKKMSIDFGYSHLFLDETPIDNTDENGYTVKGLYDSQVDIFSAQFNYNF